MKIALFGGSFNPAHDGHIYISSLAKKYLAVDYIWWIISPKNPDKSLNILRPFSERINIAQSLTKDIPFIRITDIESHMFNATKDTQTVFLIQYYLRRYQNVEFIWLSGADSVLRMHTWRDIDWIFHHISFAIFSRYDAGFLLKKSHIAIKYAIFQRPISMALRLGSLSKPAWIFFPIRLHHASSTVIRSQVQ